MPTAESSIPGPTPYPQAQSIDEIQANLASVRERIDAAAQKAGRDPAEIRLLPVSKTVPAQRLRLAIDAGCHLLGENKVQEAKSKHDDLIDLEVEWALIGHLQTNKARDVAAFTSEFQALDSTRVAQALDRKLEAAGRTLDVFVEVNTSGEESKHGLAPNQVLDFLKEIPRYTNLRIRGLMTLAAHSTDTERVRSCFARLRELRDDARTTDPNLVGPGELSMGMSGDFELAIEEGATCVRIGQAIFGARPTVDSMR